MPKFGSMLFAVTDTQPLACSTTSEVVKDMFVLNVDAWPCRNGSRRGSRGF